MWMFYEEDRIVTEAEWACLKIGLESLLDHIECEDEGTGNTGVIVFDQLTAAQRRASLASICEALKDASVSAPELTAVNEGTLAAVLQTFWSELLVELDLSDGEEYPLLACRRALLGAFEEEEDPDTLEMLPSEEEPDFESWESVFESFESRFLQDTDYQLVSMLDLPVDESESMKSNLGIDNEYFVSVAPDPTERQMHRVNQTLAKLLNLPCPDDNGLFPTIDDRFTGLRIGPCSAEEIAEWEKHPWVNITTQEKPVWDCDFRVWHVNFSKKLPATDPKGEARLPEYDAHRRQRREAALQALGAWPEF